MRLARSVNFPHPPTPRAHERARRPRSHPRSSRWDAESGVPPLRDRNEPTMKKLLFACTVVLLAACSDNSTNNLLIPDFTGSFAMAGTIDGSPSSTISGSLVISGQSGATVNVMQSTTFRRERAGAVHRPDRVSDSGSHFIERHHHVDREHVGLQLPGDRNTRRKRHHGHVDVYLGRGEHLWPVHRSAMTRLGGIVRR